MIIKFISGFLFLLALFFAKKYIQAVKTNDENAQKKNSLWITIISVALAVLTFFVSPVVENNTINDIKDSYNSLSVEVENISNTVTDIESVVDSIVINGPIEHLQIIAPQGGGQNHEPVVTVEEDDSSSDAEPFTAGQSGVDDIEELETWTVGWSDSNGGRNEYSLQQVNDGVLNSTVVFNSISDGSFGHEFNFVGARENNGVNNGFNANAIEVEKGKTYVVRLFAHNNSLIPTNVAHDVRIRFAISDPKHVLNVSEDVEKVITDVEEYEAGYYGVAVHGYISSSNADPLWVSDGVKFVSDKPFHLEYVIGTAKFENNGIGNAENGGYRLGDEIMEDGVLIGYDKIDGNVPACYQYSSYSSIIVMPVFD